MAKFMNVDTVDKNIVDDKGETTSVKMKVSRKDFDAILDTTGVTKEVRDLVKESDETIAKEAIAFLGKQVLDTKLPHKLVLATNDGAREFSLGGKEEYTSRLTGETSEKYGKCKIKITKRIPRVLVNGDLSDIQAQIEKSFKK